MTPILTLWPSASTVTLARQTEADVRGNVAATAGIYESVECHDMTPDELAGCVSSRFRDMIRLTSADTTLHIVAVITLYEHDSQDRLRAVVDACGKVSDRISLHVIGLRGSLAGAAGGRAAEGGAEEKVLESLGVLAENGAVRYSFTVIDDYAANGAAFGFTPGTLAGYLALLLSALMRGYHSILSPAVINASRGCSLAMGASSVRLDRRRCGDYMLHRAFLSALEREGVGVESVDSAKAADVALRSLRGIDGLFEKFYDKEVASRYRDSRMTEGEIVGELDVPLREEFSRLETHLTAFLHDPELSLPEKEGVLALILGEDNSLLRGVQYDQDSLVLDDGISVPVDLYVDTFNTLGGAKGALPLRAEFPGLRKTGVLDSLDNENAFNPLGSIKRLKKEIQNTTAFIRRKSGELNDIEALCSERRKVREVRGGMIGEPGRRVSRDVREQPLDAVYTPAQDVSPGNSVDLREYFSPVREQGELGACATFAAVAMYEAEINRRAPKGSGRSDLSEQFVYHYTNVVTGRKEGGSNFHEQFAVMGRMGVCDEQLFGYTSSNLGKEPPQAAVDNALTHRVLQAMQIPLESAGSKIDCIDRNHRLLTSALSEGYPVGISLTIYGSFADRAPFVSRPDQSDLESGEAGAHAMVIVGYSESDRCYIVRNSWGKEFGDNGYCYISSSYVDDPEYNRFACIIASTTEEGAEGLRRSEAVPELVAPFGGDENEIKAAAIRNVLDRERVRLDSLESLYRELYRYYQQLLQQLGNHVVRNDLRMRAESHSCLELARLSDKESALHASFVGTLKEFRHNYIKGAMVLTSGTLLYDIVYLLLWWKIGWEPGVWATLVAAFFTIITVFVWLGYKWECRRKRRELNEQLADLAVERSNAERDYMEKQLRYHVAGMWIDSFHELQVRLQRTYNRIMAFNAGLRRWSEEDREALDQPERESGQMFLYLEDMGRLKALFEANEERIAGGISLMDCLDRYLGSGVELDLLREHLDREVGRNVDAMFDDFSMSDYLTGTRTYPYLAPPQLASVITRMLGVGQPSLRHKSSEALPPAIFLLLHLDDRQTGMWRRTTDPLFPFPPSVVRAGNPCWLDIVTVQPVPLAAVR